MADLFTFEELGEIFEPILPVPGAKFAGGVQDVVLDSRNCRKGSLFVALKGLVTDGHRYLNEAFRNGAAAALVEALPENETKKNNRAMNRVTPELCSESAAETGANPDPADGRSGEGEGKPFFFKTENTLKGLHLLARFHRRKNPAIRRIGITGSSGKTSTKELLASVLEQHGDCIRTEGNLNSETGLPLSLLQIKSRHRYGVFELGISRPGEMALMAETLKPHMALITNVGKTHLEFLSSVRGVADEKRKLFSFLEEGGKALLWEKEPMRDYLSKECPDSVVFFGESSTPGYRKYRDRGEEGLEIFWKNDSVLVPFVGAYNVPNILAALRAALLLGVSDEAVLKGLASGKPPAWRSRILSLGAGKIFQDFYNANPDSMKAVLRAEETLYPGKRHVLVLGDMLELGAEGRRLHEELGEELAGKKGMIFLFGPLMRSAFEAVSRKRKEDVFWFEKTADGREALKNLIRKDDFVVLKSSLGMGFRQIQELLHTVMR